MLTFSLPSQGLLRARLQQLPDCPHSFLPNSAPTALSKGSVTAAARLAQASYLTQALTVPSKGSVTAAARLAQASYQMLTLPRTGLLAAPTSVQRYSLFGWSLSQHFWPNPTSIQDNLLFWMESLQHFWLYPTSVQKKFLFGWSQSKYSQLTLHPFAEINKFGWSFFARSKLITPSLFKKYLKGWSPPYQVIPYLLTPRHLVKRRGAMNPTGFHKADIPRFT